MGNEVLKKRLRKRLRVGWRISITITIILLITMFFFEFLTYMNFDRFQGNPSGFIKIHVIHAIVTIILLLIPTIFLLAKFVVNPVYKILLAIEDMQSGKLVTPLEIKSNDEFELLAKEFNEMGIQLREQVQQKVRTEKYSTASAFTKRVANTLSEPCASLRANVKLLKEIGKGNPQVENFADLLLKDIIKIEEKLKEISKIEIPEELKT